MLGFIIFALAQPANPSPDIPDLEGASFEFRSCANTGEFKSCTYAAKSTDDDYDIYYLSVREGFYMVAARSVQCNGDFNSKMDAGSNFFFTPERGYYRSGEGAGFDQLLLRDVSLVCKSRPVRNGLPVEAAYRDAQVRFSSL